jgi:dihydroxy-acid dehydratase
MAGPASAVVFALYSSNLQNDVAFVSDGQLSGLCNKGLTVAEVSPEAATGGPLGLVETGDTITIDVDRQSIDLEVTTEALAARRTRLGAKPMKATSGWLSIYREQVQPMSRGVVLVKNR